MSAEITRFLSSVYHSRSSLETPKKGENEKIRADERAKLSLLVKTWKTKYEKAQNTTRHHSEYIRSLEDDVARLREEKHKVYDKLTMKMEKEREKYENTIQQLKMQKKIAEHDPALETEDFRQKPDRIKRQTDPEIASYKSRDEQTDQKMITMQNTIANLKKIIKNLKLERQKYIENESISKTEKDDNNTEDLKTKFTAEVERIKNLCAEKIAEAEQRVKEVEEKSVAAAAKFEEESKNLEMKVQQKILDAKEEIEKEYKEQAEQLALEHEKHIQTLVEDQKSKKVDSEDKSIMIDLDDPWFKEERDSLDCSIREAIEKLKKSRCAYYSSFFWEFDGKLHKAQRPEVSYTTMSELVKELSACQQSLREIKKVLDRYDQPAMDKERFAKFHLLVEVDFNTKVHEIEYIRRLIRLKRLNPSSGRPPWSLGGYSNPGSNKRSDSSSSFEKTQIKPSSKSYENSKKSKSLMVVIPKTLKLEVPQHSHQTQYSQHEKRQRSRMLPKIPPDTTNNTSEKRNQSTYTGNKVQRPLVEKNFAHRRTYQSSHTTNRVRKFPAINPRPPIKRNETSQRNYWPARNTNRRLILPRINDKKISESLNKRVQTDHYLNRQNSAVHFSPIVNGRQYHEIRHRGYWRH